MVLNHEVTELWSCSDVPSSQTVYRWSRRHCGAQSLPVGQSEITRSRHEVGETPDRGLRVNVCWPNRCVHSETCDAALPVTPSSREWGSRGPCFATGLQLYKVWTQRPTQIMQGPILHPRAVTCSTAFSCPGRQTDSQHMVAALSLRRLTPSSRQPMYRVQSGLSGTRSCELAVGPASSACYAERDVPSCRQCAWHSNRRLQRAGGELCGMQSGGLRLSSNTRPSDRLCDDSPPSFKHAFLCSYPHPVSDHLRLLFSLVTPSATCWTSGDMFVQPVWRFPSSLGPTATDGVYAQRHITQGHRLGALTRRPCIRSPQLPDAETAAGAELLCPYFIYALRQHSSLPRSVASVGPPKRVPSSSAPACPAVRSEPATHWPVLPRSHRRRPTPSVP